MSRSQSQLYSDEEDDLDKELDAFIEEKTEPDPVTETKVDQNVNEPPKNNIASDSEGETEEKGQRETSGEKSTDDEWDEQELSEHQKRAMKELEDLRNMDDGLPSEDPPEYDVTARVKQLNEELANDTTPTDKKRESRVLFKEDLVDLVAPPPDYGEGEETPRQNQESNTVSDKSEPANNNSKSATGSERSDQKVLIERGGNFELVNADEVTADDMGLPLFDNDKENEDDNANGAGNTNNNNSSSSFNRKPAPPSNPRPSTATGPSRRSVRPAQKARAQSAGSRNSSINHSFSLNHDYKSPYALSLKEKEMLEQQNKHKEEQKREDERRKRKDEEDKQNYNEDLFQSWLTKVRQREKQRREKEEEEMRKNQKPDKRRSKDKQKNMGQDEYDDSDDDEERSKDMWKDDYEDYSDESDKNSKMYKEWVQCKLDQKKREKLLTKRQEQEANEGLIIRSRDDCDKAFREWLRRKNTDLKRARAVEKQKARMMRIVARKARKTQALTKAVRQSNAFRYVDYYGYRF